MNTYKYIEDYIDDDLNNDKLKSFLDEVKDNKAMAEELNLRMEINNVIHDKGFNELKDILEKQKITSKQSYSSYSIRREVMRTWHMAAASFALVIVAGGLWYILSNKPYTTEKLVGKYYKPAKSIGQVRSGQVSGNETLAKAFNFYKQNDYNNALTYFSSLDNQITSKFYSGICFIELKKYDDAIDSFETVVNDNDNLYVEQADWYLGLIYLMNNQKENAIEKFNNIAVSDSYYADQAKEIVKYIR